MAAPLVETEPWHVEALEAAELAGVAGDLQMESWGSVAPLCLGIVATASASGAQAERFLASSTSSQRMLANAAYS